MSQSRLTHALQTGALTLPTGPVAVLGPLPGYDLTGFDRATTVIVTHDALADAHWQAAGVQTTRAPEGPFAAALVVLPRARAAQKALIAEAAGLAPLVLVDGAKQDGIDSILKAVRAQAPLAGTLSKAHGKLFWLEGAAFPEWQDASQEVAGFTTRPGVFSADGPDPGSVALAAAVPPLKGKVADLGAGWGYLARTILESEAVTALHLIETDAVALDCARDNAADPRALYHWADATTWRPPTLLDAVVSNPPFHRGRAGDPDLGRAFIAAAARCLSPSGHFWMVANRHLPYEATLETSFAEVETHDATPGFKIFHATKPRRARR